MIQHELCSYMSQRVLNHQLQQGYKHVYKMFLVQKGPLPKHRSFVAKCFLGGHFWIYCPEKPLISPGLSLKRGCVFILAKKLSGSSGPFPGTNCSRRLSVHS